MTRPLSDLKSDTPKRFADLGVLPRAVAQLNSTGRKTALASIYAAQCITPSISASQSIDEGLSSLG